MQNKSSEYIYIVDGMKAAAAAAGVWRLGWGLRQPCKPEQNMHYEC